VPPSSTSPTGIDPAALLAIGDLELRARVVVEGMWNGLHRSPFSGFSVEFSEYRQYVPGDDLRWLDWKVLARTDREYVRKFEDETNVRCHLLVDTSRSMSFGSASYSKFDYARTLAAALAAFLVQQRDMVGLALFADALGTHLPARWRQGHLRRLLLALDAAQPSGATDLAASLETAGRLWRKRGIVVLVSDLLEPVDSWENSVALLVAAGHDVRVFQVLDPAELTLRFGRAAEWEDLESGSRLLVDPDAARQRYRERLDLHLSAATSALASRGVPVTRVTTDEPLDLVLTKWMHDAARRRRGRAQRTRRPA
jgi:uncharacterized protein (DUF58 family)